MATFAAVSVGSCPSPSMGISLFPGLPSLSREPSAPRPARLSPSGLCGTLFPTPGARAALPPALCLLQERGIRVTAGQGLRSGLPTASSRERAPPLRRGSSAWSWDSHAGLPLPLRVVLPWEGPGGGWPSACLLRLCAHSLGILGPAPGLALSPSPAGPAPFPASSSPPWTHTAPPRSSPCPESPGQALRLPGSMKSFHRPPQPASHCLVNSEVSVTAAGVGAPGGRGRTCVPFTFPTST